MVQSVINQIKSFYPTMRIKEKKIADFFLQNQQTAPHMSITEIAEQLGTANSTIFRFTQKIGFKGYQDFKLALAKETVQHDNKPLFEEIQPEDDLETITKKVFTANIRSLQDTNELLDTNSLAKALDLLKKCQTLAFFGSGGSAVVALDAYHKFLRSPIRCSYSMDHHFQLMQAAQMTDKDVALLISHSGANKDILDIAKILSKNSVPMIVITSHAGAPLTKFATCCFFSIAEEAAYRSEALSSRISQLSIIDTLYVTVSVTEPEASAKALEKVREVIRDTREK